MSAKSRRKVISCEALQYECGICLREFSTSWCLQLHIRTHSEQKSFDCHECGMTYPDFSALCEHLKVHIFGADPVEQDAEPPSISCHQDPVSLTDGNQMSHGFKPQLTCATCEKRFGSFKALKLHSRIHKTKKLVQTQEPWNLSTGETSRTFGSEGNQEDNKKEGTQNVKSKRGRKRRNGNLELTGYFLKVGKKYRCEVCAKKLSSRSFMEKHILKHQTGQFHCSHCDKFFATNTDLKDHEKLHQTAGEPTIPHKIVVDDHVKAAELVVADGKGFSCIVCKKTFDSKQKAHVHILCHKKRKRRRKLNRSKPGSKSSTSSDTSLNRQDVSDMGVKAGVSAGPSHMTAGSADTTLSLCCEECKEEFSTQDELVHHQNLHIRDHTMALMRILKPGTNLDVSIVETQTLVDAVHSATDVLTATNKEALFRNTSRQELISSGVAINKEALFRNTSRQELASSDVATNKEALFRNTSRQELASSDVATNKESLFRNTSRQELASSDVATNKEALFRNTSRQELASSDVATNKESLFRNTSRQELASSDVATNKEALFRNTSRQELASSDVATNKEALFGNTSRQELASCGAATNKEALFRNTSRQDLASSDVATNKEALFRNTSRQELASSDVATNKEALFRNTSRQELASSDVATNKEALFRNTSRQELVSSGVAINKEALYRNTSRQELVSSGVAINKEALFRNTSRQELASSGVHHQENCRPYEAALESSSQRNLLKAFPNVQCNAKVVLKRLEDENLLCQNGVETVFRHSKGHRNERDDHTRQRKLDEETETVCGTGECHQTEGTLSDNSKALQEGGDFSGDNEENDDIFRSEDDIENDHYSVSATGSSDLMSSEHAQDVSSAKDDSAMMSAENVHDSAPTKELVSPEAHSNCNTGKLSSLAKSILKNVAEKGDKFSCKICEVEFSELQKAKNHVRIHVAKKRFECKFCPAKFVYASKLLSHQATHAPEILSPKKTRLTTRCHYENVGKEFICNICDKPFKTKHKVQCHVRYHLLEDTYQCRFCQRCFRKKYSLLNHEKTHSEASGEGSKTTSRDDGKTEDEETEKVTLKFKRGKYKEFTEAVNDVLKCKLCESTFRNNKQIIDHFRSHFAERKFWCTICSAAFKRNTHLEVHMKAHDRVNMKGQQISISEGVKGAMNVEKKNNVKMIKEKKSEDGANVVNLSADTSIVTEGIKDRGGETGGCIQPELPSGDACLLESVTMVTIPVHTNHEQASVATLSQEDGIRNNVIGEKSSTTEALTNSCLNQHPISTAAEMVKHHPLTDPDGAAVTCRSSGEEGHFLVGHAETTVTSAEGTNDKEPLSNTKRQIRDHSSAVTVDLSDEEDGAGEQKDTTCAAPAAVAACARDGAETETKAKTEPSADFITVHGLHGSKNTNEIGDVKMLIAASDEDGGGLVDDVSDDNDLDSDFKYEPDMDYDSDISNDDLRSARNRRPPIKYLYDASASCTDGCSAGEGERKDANINKSSGSENDVGPSRNKHDVQITFCNPKKKTSKSTNKPSRKGITVAMVASGSKGQGRQVITQMNTGEKVTQHVGQLEKLKMETISSQGQDVGGVHHEDEAQDCPVGPNTTDTEEECALMDTTSSDCQYSPQKHQTEYTIEAGGSFRCVFCDKVFKSLLNIRSHLSIEHDLFRCKVCIATFQTHQELKKHNEENKHLQFRVLSNRNISTKIEIVGEMFKCNLCNKMFSDKGKCALHVRHHLTAFKYICDICSQACKSRSVLAAHMSIHNNSCSFECKACFNMYPNMGSLRYHEKSHTEEDKINILNYVKCDTCGDLCVNEKMLEKHVLQHKDSHTCDFCKMSFQTYTALQNHQSVEQHHKCEYCGKTYKDQKYLRKHIRTVHTKQEAHMCDKCGKSLSSQAGLRAHMALHTGTAKFQCSMCNLKFQHAGKLEHHMKAHEAGGGLCELCKKFFRTQICLKVHKLMHQALEAAGEDLGNTKGLLMRGLSEYTCPCCKKTVGTVEQLRQHIKHHFVERRFKCTMCDMSFFNNYYLETHIRIHNKDFSFHCDQCPRTFASSNFLNNHIKKIHLKSDRGRFPCDICKKIFRTKAGVGSHKRLHKDRVRGHPCDLCELSFFSPSELKAHKQTHSSVRAFMCDLCGVSYKTKYMLRNHMLRHEGRKDFKCDLCGKEFFLKAYLQIHLRNHKNERNFRCNICDKGFNHPNSLNDHKRIHTGEKPYKCKSCDRKFTDRSARRTHEFSHKVSTSKTKGKVDL